MRPTFCLLAVVALLGSQPNCPSDKVYFFDGSWDPASTTFKWWAGEVQLPPGFTYRIGGGGDSFTGTFTSPARKLVVSHDIGASYISGAYASQERSFVFNEKIVDGARVWTAKRDVPFLNGGHTILVAVTFPDCQSANFFLYSVKPEDAEVIDFIARSFKPKPCR
jgi:hypothetical protein